jgi:signal transduction histidine kinase
MVSERSRDFRSSDQAHLGLGLYIVRLIAEYHRGRYFARNLADGSGVLIGIEIPVQ